MGETTRNAIYDTVRTVGHHSDMLTAISLLLSILAALVITQGLLVIGGLLVLLAGTFDMFDGAMARVQNASTSFGAFFDSTLDIAIPRASSCSVCLFMHCRGRQTSKNHSGLPRTSKRG